jgi:flavin reductase (DIM6/NTAB) family NADH-FMN oxidoreductase RutF
MPIDTDSFRAVLGRFASGVTVITARDAQGRDHGMTVSAFSSLSLSPPLVLVCVDHTASMYPVLEQATVFAVNILAAGQEAVSRRFASREGDRFKGLGFSRGLTECALLDDTQASLECRITARHHEGDHMIVVGHVEAAAAHDLHPLLYYRSGYASLTR